MTQIFADPFIRLFVLPFAFTVILVGLIRFVGREGSSRAAGGTVALAFVWLCGLILGIPDFPPPASSAALAYIVTVGVVVGAAFDLMDGKSVAVGWVAGLVFALISSWWMGGAPPFFNTDKGNIVVVLALAATWLIVQLRLRRLSQDARLPTAMLIMAAFGLGIVAWIAGAAEELGLAFGLTSALVGFFVWNWPRPHFPLGNGMVISAGAAIMTLAFRLVEGAPTMLPALIILGFVFFADTVSWRARWGPKALWGAVHPFMLAALCLLPLGLAAAAARIGIAVPP